MGEGNHFSAPKQAPISITESLSITPRPGGARFMGLVSQRKDCSRRQGVYNKEEECKKKKKKVSNKNGFGSDACEVKKKSCYLKKRGLFDLINSKWTRFYKTWTMFPLIYNVVMYKSEKNMLWGKKTNKTMWSSGMKRLPFWSWLFPYNSVLSLLYHNHLPIANKSLFIKECQVILFICYCCGTSKKTSQFLFLLSYIIAAVNSLLPHQPLFFPLFNY